MLVLILYSAWMVPLRVCFRYDAVGWLWWFEVTMALAFLLDIVFTFNTVYFDLSTGNWVISRAKVREPRWLPSRPPSPTMPTPVPMRSRPRPRWPPR